ncbi:hypothetical protein SLS54_003019 [Diplodia seriata]
MSPLRSVNELSVSPTLSNLRSEEDGAPSTTHVRPSLSSLPIELRLMIYDHHLKNLGPSMCPTSHRARLSDGAKLHFPALGQINRKLRMEFMPYYVQRVAWRIEVSPRGLSLFRRWIKILGAHSRHLRRLCLHGGRGSYIIRINLITGEQHGYFYITPDLCSVFFDQSWLKDYIRQQIVVPLAKKIKRGTFKGNHVIAAIEQLLEDNPRLHHPYYHASIWWT